MRGAPGTWQWLCWWDGADIDLERTFHGPPDDLRDRGLPVTDADAAHAIMAQYPGLLHHVRGLDRGGTWYAWDGRSHAVDESGRVSMIITEFARNYRRAVAACANQDRAECQRGGMNAGQVSAQVARWDKKAKYAAAVLGNGGHDKLAAYLAKECSARPADLDEKHPEWLNAANVTVHLTGHGWHGHTPADMLTYSLDTPWVPELAGQHPRFTALVSRACGSPEEAGYLWRVLGYSLLGANPERRFFILKGPTTNGKTTILTIVSKLLGTLATEGKADLIAVTRHGRNARTEFSIRGKRLVRIVETSEHNVIEEGQLKRLTGETEVAVDRHYATTTLSTPVTWTIFMATNEMPAMPAFDEALRRRVAVVPVSGQPLEEAEIIQGLAEEILASEGPAILASLVEACRHVVQAGTRPPVAALVATDEYRDSQNTVGEFLADMCVMRPGPYPARSVPPHISRPEAWRRYRDWSKGSSGLLKKQFYDALKAEPGITWNPGSLRFEGLAWKDDMSSVYSGMPPI